MRETNITFLSELTPSAIVRFEAFSAGGSLTISSENSSVIYVGLPAGHECTASPTKELFDRLSELKKKYLVPSLPNSEPPSALAFQDAKTFVLTLPLARLVKPIIHVASDGEVNFQWSGPDFRIDLGFYGNEKFSFYGAKKGQNPI